MLKFDEFPGELAKLEDQFKQAEETLSVEPKKEETPATIVRCLDSAHCVQVLKEKEKKKAEKEENPDELIFKDENEDDDTSSDTDSIESFEMEDDESDLKPVKTPKYI